MFPDFVCVWGNRKEVEGIGDEQTDRTVTVLSSSENGLFQTELCPLPPLWLFQCGEGTTCDRVQTRTTLIGSWKWSLLCRLNLLRMTLGTRKNEWGLVVEVVICYSRKKWQKNTISSGNTMWCFYEWHQSEPDFSRTFTQFGYIDTNMDRVNHQKTDGNWWKNRSCSVDNKPCPGQSHLWSTGSPVPTLPPIPSILPQFFCLSPNSLRFFILR